MSEMTEYRAGKRMANGVMYGFALFLAAVIIVPSGQETVLDPREGTVLPGREQADVFGFACDVTERHVQLDVTQPLVDGPDGDGFDRKALEEMAGKGYGRANSSSSFEDLVMDYERSDTGKSRRKKADDNESGGWLVSLISSDEEDVSSGEDTREAAVHVERIGSRLIDESGGVRSDILYGDREPGSR